MILFALVSLLSASLLSSCVNSALVESRGQQDLCLWRCNATNRVREARNHGQVRSFRSCYKDCQKKRSKRDKLASDVQNSSGSAGGKSIMLTRRRVRRSWPLGPGCPNNTENFTDLKYPNVTVTFHKNNNSADWFANVSWTPITNAAVNWTGYVLRYNIGRHHGIRSYRCKVVSKNETNVIMNPKKEGWKDPYDPIYVHVSAVPFNEVIVYPKEIQAPAGFFPTTTTSPGFLLTTTTSIGWNKRAIYISTIFGSISGLALLAYLFRRFSQFIKRKPQTSKWTPELKPIPEGFKYHAFIIFSSKDAKWVSGTLLRTLEEENSFRCCVHYRDFLPGVPFRDNMVNSIYSSCKIIAVISKNFFESPFCDFELQTALYRLLENRDDSVVIIRRDKVNSKKLPQELRFRSFIDFSNALDRKSWESKLLRFLETSLVCEEHV